MTEVPEHLLKRARDRREAVTQPPRPGYKSMSDVWTPAEIEAQLNAADEADLFLYNALQGMAGAFGETTQQLIDRLNNQIAEQLAELNWLRDVRHQFYALSKILGTIPPILDYDWRKDIPDQLERDA